MNQRLRKKLVKLGKVPRKAVPPTPVSQSLNDAESLASQLALLFQSPDIDNNPLSIPFHPELNDFSGAVLVERKKNPASFFLGEKKIVECYQLLQSVDSRHLLLTFGKVRSDGHFRFDAAALRSATWPLNTLSLAHGVPESPRDTLHFIEQLFGAAVENGALRRED